MLSRLKIAPRLTILIVLGTILIVVALRTLDYRGSRGLLEKELLERAEAVALATAREIRSVQRAVEKVVEQTVVALRTRALDTEEVYRLLEDTVRQHEEIYGSAVLRLGGEKATVPYVFEQGGKFVRKDLAGGGYEYEKFDWYSVPKETRSAAWTEPYLDEGGGEEIMVTYSMPILDGAERRFGGLVTGDLSLEWLGDLLRTMHLPAEGYAFLISRKGTIISHPRKDLILRESIFSVADRFGREDMQELGRRMTGQETGFLEYRNLLDDEPTWLAYSPVAGSGWSLGVVFPQERITEALHQLDRTRYIFGALGILAMVGMALAIARSISRPIRELDAAARVLAKGNLDAALPELRGKDEVANLGRSFAAMRGDLKQYIEDLRSTTEAKTRIEDDLRTARTIQLDLLPSRFQLDPPVPQVDIHAILEPAKAVGGDFYDFFPCGKDRLFVAVADVSGKGVPAAIFMAVSKAYLKAFATQTDDPAAALSRLNDELAIENDEAMYVTVFCAYVDTRTGECRYASGGHVPPLILRRSGEVVTPRALKGGLIGLEGGAHFEAGSFRLEPGDLLFSSSDGVIEAEDVRQEFYGEERTQAALSRLGGRSSKEVLEAVREDVRRFAEGAEQSDDITLLAVRYVG